MSLAPQLFLMFWALWIVALCASAKKKPTDKNYDE